MDQEGLGGHLMCMLCLCCGLAFRVRVVRCHAALQ